MSVLETDLSLLSPLSCASDSESVNMDTTRFEEKFTGVWMARNLSSRGGAGSSGLSSHSSTASSLAGSSTALNLSEF